jgi:hypothetical protein
MRNKYTSFWRDDKKSREQAGKKAPNPPLQAGCRSSVF